MPLLATLPFLDSFDHYNALNTKWLLASGSIDLTGTLSRTGIGACILSGTTDGPFLVFTAIPRFTIGTAFYPSLFPQPTFGGILNLIESVANVRQIQLVCYPDMSIGVLNENLILGRSAPGQLVLASYNYIEVDATISAAGNVIVRVNEQIILSLTGVRTQYPGSLSLVNVLRLKGFGGSAACRHDDLYLRDPGGETFGQSFYGAQKCNAIVPNADASPLNWGPSPGPTNFAMVNEVPPDGNTTFVSSDTPGAIDQYGQSNAVLPAGANIVCVQHCLDMTDAAVARSVASCADGVIATGRALTNAYLIYQFPYERTWTAAQVGSTKFGPAVTA